MSDLIDRQAALDIYDDYNVAVENGELEAYGKHRKRLLELPPAQPGWIPCSVMLPENDGVYLVTLRAITQLQKACAKIDIARFDGKWHKAYPVVAWMPLPKPWKGGQDG